MSFYKPESQAPEAERQKEEWKGSESGIVILSVCDTISSILMYFVIFKYWNMYLVLGNTVVLILERMWILNHLWIRRSMTQWFNLYRNTKLCSFFPSRQNHTHKGCNKQPDVRLQSSHWKDWGLFQFKDFLNKWNMKAPVLKLTKVPPSQSPHDETKKFDKGKSNRLASKQNITASHDKKIVTLKDDHEWGSIPSSN